MAATGTTPATIRAFEEFDEAVMEYCELAKSLAAAALQHAPDFYWIKEECVRARERCLDLKERCLDLKERIHS